MKKRIVVTGMGIVSCFGNDIDLFYKNLLNGVSGISEITEFPCNDFPTRFAGWIKDFNSEPYLDKKQARRVDKYIAYSVVAGKKALEYGKIDSTTLNSLDKTRCGVIVGSGMGGLSVFEDGVLTLKEKGWKRITPFFIPFVISNMGSAMLGMELGFMGPNYSVSTACATANYAMIAAANHIRNGDADLMLCGGCDAAITPVGLAGFCACRALSQRNEDPTKASRPWDKDRDGFVMGEGAGVLVLESLEHALARGATIFAEFLGGGISCDAYHMTEPRQDGAGVSLCIHNALKNAGVNPKEVNYINAHATSTPLGDMAEIDAIKSVFSNRSKIVMNSTKSLIGHGLGASSAFEAIVTIKAITDGIVHPTINLENPEPGLDFCIPREAQPLKVNVAISNSFGFGGHNATIVLAPYHETKNNSI